MFYVTRVLIFSASQSMDDEAKHDVHSETSLQVSDATCEYSESTESDIEENNMCSAVSSDYEMNTDFLTHHMDDYNVSQGITYAHERLEDIQAGDAYSRQGDDVDGHMVNCLLSVKCEEHNQALNEQGHVIPVNTIHQETNWTRDVNETIQVKQEKKEYPDGYDRSSEVTIHWVVCPDGVLEEVKTEHTSDVSDVLSSEDCNENFGCKLRTRTCTHHDNIHEEETNGNLSTDSTCDETSNEFRRHDNVLKVQERTSKGVKHFTDTCGEHLAHLSEYKVRERTHTGDKPFTCDKCGKSFSQSGHLKLHERIHSGIKPFTCDTCGKSFARPRMLKIHEMIHTGIKPFACDACEKSFAQAGELKVHQRIHTGVKPFTCDICGKSFVRAGDLTVHERIHTGVKRFTCDTCGKSFTRSRDLKGHEIVHTCVKSFTCDTCGKLFARFDSLKRHEITHTVINKSFTCDACGKSFAQAGNLRVHEKIHTGVKPFTCDTCGKSFTRSGDLKQHEMRHGGIKPFICDTCGKSFTQPGERNRHERTHRPT